MKNNHKQSKFTKLVRIRKDQLSWLQVNKGSYTLAGKLDEIINAYKYDRSAGTTGLPAEAVTEDDGIRGAV